MLHAELAGKIAPDADDIARREDVLTSTVFGTLFLANAWPLLMRWMVRAQPVGNRGALSAADPICVGSYWFWPRLHEAEPDIVIRCGPMLLVVEAKYLSGKSGGSVFDGETMVEATDQLVREWCARVHNAATVSGGFEPGRSAVEVACGHSVGSAHVR